MATSVKERKERKIITVFFRYSEEFDTVEAFWLWDTSQGVMMHFEGLGHCLELPYKSSTPEYEYWMNFNSKLPIATHKQYKVAKERLELKYDIVIEPDQL